MLQRVQKESRQQDESRGKSGEEKQNRQQKAGVHSWRGERWVLMWVYKDRKGEGKETEKVRKLSLKVKCGVQKLSTESSKWKSEADVFWAGMRWKSRQLNCSGLWRAGGAERQQERLWAGREEVWSTGEEFKPHCSERAEAERAEESNSRQTLDNMDVSSAMEKVGQKRLHLYSWNF